MPMLALYTVWRAGKPMPPARDTVTVYRKKEGNTVVIRIVLIDDSTTFLAVASRFLTKHEELKVVGAVSEGRLAVGAASQLQPDIVLVDLAMPDMSGIEVIPLLRQAMPNVGIIALTFLEEKKYYDAVLSSGADAFVAKEDLTSKLVPTILNVAHMRGHVQQATMV